MVDGIFKCFSPSLCQKHEGDFLWYLLWDLKVYFTKVDLIVVWGFLLWWGLPGVFVLELSTLSLQQFINYSLGFSVLALLFVEVSTHEPALINHDSLCFPACLESQRQLCFLSHLLQIQKELKFFSIRSTYLLRWNGNSQAPYMQKWKLALDNLFKMLIATLILCPQIYPESIYLLSISTVMNLDQATIIYFLDKYHGFLIDASTSIGLALISFSHCGKNNLPWGYDFILLLKALQWLS